MRCLFFFVAWLLGGWAAAAQPVDCPPAPASSGAAPDGRDRGVLWRLDKDGRSSWLYGTVHAGRAEWALPGPRLRAALAQSQVLALELDPDDPSLAAVMTQAGEPDRVRRVAGAVQQRLARLAAANCIDAARLRPLPPLYQLMVLSMQDGRRDGFHPELGADLLLHAFWRAQRKELVALETPGSQRAALMAATEEDERALVAQGVTDLERGASRRVLRRLLAAWAEGDAAALENYAQWCECLETPAARRYLQRLNDDRNGPMADRLAAIHAEGRSFFAALGTLHMSGPQALTRLLRAHGFAVHPVSLAPNPTP